jgi:tetratricopeptide (TPR) repeat protein
LYQLSPRGLRIVVRTFLDEYPVVYGVFAYLNAKTPALGLLGAGENFRFSEQSFRKAFVDASPTTKKALAGVGLKHPIQALSMVIAERRALARLAKGAPRNTRDRPLIELEMPWVRWSADWSRLGAINTRKLLSLPGAIDSWLAGFSPAWRSRLGRRYRAIKVYMESRLLLREGKPARSLQLLLRAAQTDASWLLPRQLMSNLASAQIKQKRHRAALQMLRMFVRALPEHAESWALLGSTLYRTGDAAGALRAFARAHRLRPGLKMAFRNLVVMHIKQKRWDKAAEVMSRSALAKAFPGLLLKVALALTRQKRWTALLPLARALTTLTPTPKRAFAMVGYAYWKVGKGKQAIPFLERAVKRDPRSLHLRVWLVQACLQAQMLFVALKHAQAAARVFPAHGGIQLMLQQLASFRLVMQLKARGKKPIAPTSRPASRPVVRPTSRPVLGPLPGPVLPRVPPRQ